MENIPQDDALFCDLGASASPLLISAVGAGGKTSTLLWLAELFVRAGRRVLLTTTTHMSLPEQMPVIICRDRGSAGDRLATAAAGLFFRMAAAGWKSKGVYRRAT